MNVKVNFNTDTVSASVNTVPSKSLPDSDNIRKISFRNEESYIKSTTYLTHSIYYYPAKFIPHVVKYIIKHYSQKGDTVADPFAGSGTVGLEAYLNNRNAYLLDLSPLLNHIIPVKIPVSQPALSVSVLKNYLAELKLSAEFSFDPAWQTIDYWYDPDILTFLKQKWGWLKNSENNIYIRVIEANLVKLSKYFSYAEHRMPKLFRSKHKTAFMDELLQSDWKQKFYNMLEKSSIDTLKDINDLLRETRGYAETVEFHGGVDTPNYVIPRDKIFDLVITSPPYLQAQEYFRTIKMDLFWLGHTEEEIKELSKLEIPYRKPDNIVHTETLDGIRDKLSDKPNLCRMLDSYFCYVIRGLDTAMSHLRTGGKACIFIGNPTVDGNPVEIWRICAEYFLDNGYQYLEVFDDEIKSRQLFGLKRNNKNPNGMKSEYLLVLEKE